MTRPRREGRVLFVGLCLATAIALNLPWSAPGCEDVRDVFVLALAVAGIALQVPVLWAWCGRFRSPAARAVARGLAVPLWIVAAAATIGLVLIGTEKPGFMRSRTLVSVVRSADGLVVFDSWRHGAWDSIESHGSALRVGPFDVPVTGDETVSEATALGHTLRVRSDADGTVRAWIDGEPAQIEWWE